MRWAAVFLVLVTLSGCTSERPRPPAAPVAEATTPASPFTLGWLPDGFRPTTFARGTRAQEWDSDEIGSDQPFTVLTHGDERVVIAVTGYAGYQGGLDQASVSYCCDDHTGRQHLRVDGKRAIWSPPFEHRSTTELLVARTPEIAVRVTAPGSWSRKRLVDIYRRTTPATDHALAPAVAPPDGWRVLGRVDAPLLLASTAYAPPPGARPLLASDGTPSVDAPAGSWAGVWEAPGKTMVVATLPGADPTALVGLPPGRAPRVERREGGVVVHGTGFTVAVRRRPGGDTALASSRDLSGDDLWRIAGSTQPTDEATWERLRKDAWGAPPKVTPNLVEALRGSRPGYQWLLQAGKGGFLPDTYVSTGCLKLSTLTYSCGQDISLPDATVTVSAGPPEPWVIVGTTADAGSVRVDDGRTTWSAPLSLLPGATPSRVAVLFGPKVGLGLLTCDPPGGQFASVKVELVDRAGRATCLHA